MFLRGKEREAGRKPEEVVQQFRKGCAVVQPGGFPTHRTGEISQGNQVFWPECTGMEARLSFFLILLG